MKPDHQALATYYAAFEDDAMREMAKANVEANFESDRGMVLIISSALESRLRGLTMNALGKNPGTKGLFADRGPLDSFYAVALMARSLDKISDEELSDIHRIRRTRNLFAHEIDCSFETAAVRKCTRGLTSGLSKLDVSTLSDSARFRLVANYLATQAYWRWKTLS